MPVPGLNQGSINTVTDTQTKYPLETNKAIKLQDGSDVGSFDVVFYKEKEATFTYDGFLYSAFQVKPNDDHLTITHEIPMPGYRLRTAQA